MTFTERTEIERGFSEVYDNQVEPILAQIEITRKQLWRKTRIYGFIILGIVVFLSGWALSTGQDNAWVTPFVFGSFGFVGWVIIYGQANKKWQGQLSSLIMPIIVEFVDNVEYDAHALESFPIELCKNLGILPSFTHSQLTDRIQGTYRDCNYTIVEAKLRQNDYSRKSDTSNKSREVFSGVVLKIEVPETILTPILIQPNLGLLGKKVEALFSSAFGLKMPLVDFEDETEFSKVFQVRAKDPENARHVLPVAFRYKLKAIAEDFSSNISGMSAGFQGQYFYLALERRTEFMNLGSVSKEVRNIEEDLHNVFKDFSLAREIIDYLRR